jgi:P27 family predicted phage terminase small subunit
MSMGARPGPTPMGSRLSGLKPRPSHLKALEGVREDRLNRDEPLPTEGVVVPPAELPAEALAVWNRKAPDLIRQKVLTTWDVDAFAAYCRAVAMFNGAAAEVESEGASVERPYKGLVPSPAFRVMVAAEKMMSSIGQRFGMTPADRAQLKVGNDGGSKSGAEAYVL